MKVTRMTKKEADARIAELKARQPKLKLTFKRGSTESNQKDN